MMKWILFIGAMIFAAPAQAQNITCSTAAFGNSSNRCASTEFVQQAIAGGGGGGGFPALSENRVFVGNSSNIATGVTMNGDCTIIAAGTITCTKQWTPNGDDIYYPTGNVGIGGAPAAWGSQFTYVLQVGNAAFSDVSGITVITANQYYDGAAFRYLSTAAAAQYQFGNTGAHIWYTSPSGSSGSVVTNTERMRLTEGGTFQVQSLGGSGSGLVAVDNSGNMSFTSGSGGGGSACTVPTVNGNGTADNYTAIQTAITAIQSVGYGCIQLPCGVFNITSQLTATNTNIALLGAGSGCTTIKVSNATGGFAFTATTAHPSGQGQYRPTVQGINFQPNGGTVGKAVDIVYYDGAGATAQPTATLTDVTWSSNFPTCTQAFETGVRLKMASDASLSYLHGRSCGFGASTHLHLDGSSTAAWYGLACFSCNFGVSVYGLRMTTGSWIEGIKLTRFVVQGISYAAYADASRACGGPIPCKNTNFTINQAELNSAINNVFLNYWGAVFLQNGDYYKGVGTGDVAADNILLTNGDGYFVESNKIQTVVSMLGFSLLSINTTNGDGGASIVGNTFISSTTSGGIALVNANNISAKSNLLISLAGALAECYYVPSGDYITFGDNTCRGWTTEFTVGAISHFSLGGKGGIDTNTHWP